MNVDDNGVSPPCARQEASGSPAPEPSVDSSGVPLADGRCPSTPKLSTLTRSESRNVSGGIPAVGALVHCSVSPLSISTTKTFVLTVSPVVDSANRSASGPKLTPPEMPPGRVGFGKGLVGGRLVSVELADGQFSVALDVSRADEPAGLVVQRDAVDVPSVPVDNGLEFHLVALEVEIREVERVGFPSSVTR